MTVAGSAPDGSRVVLKRLPGLAGTGAAAALRRQAEMLAGADGFLVPTSIVEVGTALVTVSEPAAASLDRREGGPTLTVAAAASLARSLSALHRRGLEHGSIRPGNVLFAADGHPVLADTGLAAVWRGRWDDPAGRVAPPARRLSAASDIRDLARVLVSRLEDDPDGGRLPGLEDIAGAPLRWLTRRGESSLIAVLESGGQRVAGRGRPRRLGVAAVGVAAGVGAATMLGAGAFWRAPSPGARSRPIDPEPSRPRFTTSGPTVSLETAGGRTLRYRLGSPGDLALVGDWFCRGVLLPADFRPASGTVFEFSSWPAPGAPVVSSRVLATGVVGGTPRVVHGRGCDRVVVTPSPSPPSSPPPAG